jgi:hypothetical protein
LVSRINYIFMDCEIDFIDNEDSVDANNKRQKHFFKKKPIAKKKGQPDLKKAFSQHQKKAYSKKGKNQNPEDQMMVSQFGFIPSQAHFD